LYTLFGLPSNIYVTIYLKTLHNQSKFKQQSRGMKMLYL